jgi:hypothetical protein
MSYRIVMNSRFITGWWALLLTLANVAGAENPKPIFNSTSFAGWNGDTNRTWRIEQGTIVGGSLTNNVPRNEFLCTDRSYTNFVLHLKFKLVGTEGFVNAGVQVRSQRTTNPPNEMVGYQADMGDPAYWGSLYDESRRNKILAQSDADVISKALKKGDWNQYDIRCEGKRIQLHINGTQTADYTESEESIPQHGRIGLQIHGGAVAQVSYKDISVEELP